MLSRLAIALVHVPQVATLLFVPCDHTVVNHADVYKPLMRDVLCTLLSGCLDAGTGNCSLLEYFCVWPDVQKNSVASHLCLKFPQDC